MPQSDKEKAVMAILAHKNKVEKVDNIKRMLFLKKKITLEDLNKARKYETEVVPNYMKRKQDLADVHDPNHDFYHHENHYLPFTPEHIPHKHQEIDLKKITRPERKLYGWTTIPKLEHEDQSHAEQSDMERKDAGRGTISEYGGRPMPRPNENAQDWILQEDPEFTSGNRPLEQTDWRKDRDGIIHLNATTNIAERGTNAYFEKPDRKISKDSDLSIYSGIDGLTMPISQGINPFTNPLNKNGIIKRQYRKKL